MSRFGPAVFLMAGGIAGLSLFLRGPLLACAGLGVGLVAYLVVLEIFDGRGSS